VARRFVVHARGSQLAQFLVNQRQQFFGGPGVAAFDGMKDLGDFAHAGWPSYEYTRCPGCPRNKLTNDLMQVLYVEDNTEGLRYERAILATDADVDGMHIRNLMITHFFRFFEQLVHDGHVYVLETPLFRVRSVGQRVPPVSDFSDCALRRSFSNGDRRDACPTKARTTNTLICSARGLFKTLAAWIAPCSVKAQGCFRRPPWPELDIAICDIKSRNSAWLS
jgi:hypothetical protein